MGTKRIAAVVLNSVSHDARVLKEADSLAAAGYEVAIFGIQDNRCDEPLTERPGGVRIIRSDWKRRGHLTAARIILVVGILATALAVVAHVTLRDIVQDILTSAKFIELGGMVVVMLVALATLAAYMRERELALAARAGRSSGRRPSFAGRFASAPRAALQKLKNALMRNAMKGAIVEAVSQFKPDAVHCHDLSTMPIGDACRRRLGCRVVFDSHELYEEQSMATPMQKRIYRRRQRRYSGRMDAFITINQSIADHLTGRYPLLPAPVIVKNATLPTNRALVDDGRLHRAAGLPRTRKILLYQGGFALHRGLNALVRAGALLPEEWCLVMMGWGKHEPELRRIALQVDPAGDRIKFIPAAPQGELAAWTIGGSLGVIPYENVCLNHWYCTPNKLWEYPVAGVPILASPFPELAKTIRENDIGLLLDDPATPEGIAKAVCGLSEERLAQLRSNCRTYIERDNWTVYEQRLVALYDQLLGAPAERAGERTGSLLAEPKLVASGATLQSARR